MGAAAIRRAADTHSLWPGTDRMVPGHTAALDSTVADENEIERRREKEAQAHRSHTSKLTGSLGVASDCSAADLNSCSDDLQNIKEKLNTLKLTSPAECKVKVDTV